MPIQQNSDYSVMSMAEAASIINHFTPEMIDDVITKAIASVSVTYSPGLPNIPQSIELTYQQAITQMPEYSGDLISQKTNLHMFIITKLCNTFALQFNNAIADDPVMFATLLYDFLVARFDKYLVEFIAQYIIREADSFYDMIKLNGNLAQPNKYAAMLFTKNQKLANVYMNLDYCLKNMEQFDIDIKDIIYTSFGSPKIYPDLLAQNIVDVGDFYKRVYVPFIANNTAEVITNVKFKMQNAGSYNS